MIFFFLVKIIWHPCARGFLLCLKSPCDVSFLMFKVYTFCFASVASFGNLFDKIWS